MTNHHPDCDVWNATLHNDTVDAYGLDDPKVDPADYQCNSGCSPQSRVMRRYIEASRRTKED